MINQQAFNKAGRQSILSPFRIVFCFAALAVAAWVILPQLKVDLEPDEISSEITVTYTLPGSSPDVLEQQVTSIIEGVCSRLGQLKDIYSVSRYNSGYV